eukprot:TRINITY_DN1738_c0_g1_i3.p1 TRINITY_DN1738_c0_g1~~TRINITY_DN1738_c0_g1_i3.p1  ORF type:complete len:417 (-),score=160.26 TRINITY_DN1738_c0_g1_i3:12-1262(-)
MRQRRRLSEGRTETLTWFSFFRFPDLLRKYPDRAAEIIPTLKGCLNTITDPEGKATVIWMLGEYGEQIWEAPYSLEGLISEYDTEGSPVVKMALLTATVKLFIKRPPECQKMLGSLMEKAVNDFSHADVHDRALFYYRLLAFDVDEAEKVVNQEKEVVNEFVEEKEDSLYAQLLEEFNTLSVIYGQPSNRFIVDSAPKPVFVTEGGNEEEQETNEYDRDYSDQEDEDLMGSSNEEYTAPNLIGDLDDSGTSSSSSANKGKQTQSGGSSGNTMEDLLGFLDTGIGSGSGQQQQQQKMQVALKQDPQLSPQKFQQMWGNLGAGVQRQISIMNRPSGTQVVEAIMKEHNINCIASGEVQDTIKFYFFGQEDSLTGDFVLVESLVTISQLNVVTTFKSTNGPFMEQFQEFYLGLLEEVTH